MAEPEKQEPELVKRSPLKLVLSLVGVLVVAGSGVIVYLSMADRGAESEAEPTDAPPQLGPLVELTPVVVNLDEPDATRLLRVVFQLEVGSEADQTLVTERMIPLRSDVFLYLSSLRVEDVQGREKREELLEAVRLRTVPIVGEGVVRRVYFTELVIQ